jgi:polar amino acid transport system substrate-binding protein
LGAGKLTVKGYLWVVLVFGSVFDFTVSELRAKEVEVVTEYFQSYQIKNENGSLGGFAVALFEAIFKQTGDVANISVLPWGRAYKKALNEKNVMIFSISKTPNRQDKFRWVGTLSKEPLFAWGLKSKFVTKVDNLQKLKSFIFVVIRDTNPDNILSSQGFTKVFRVTSQEQLLGMVYRDRADLLVSGKVAMAYRTQTMGLDFDKLIPVYEFINSTSNLGVAFNLHSDVELVSLYQQAFKDIEQSGELSVIKKKWNIEY